MKTYLKLISLLTISLLLSSFSNIKLDAGDKIILTKLYVNKSTNPSLHESISIYDNGSINYEIKEGSQSKIPVSGKLTKDQLSKLKKLLNRSSFKYLDRSYKCDNEISDAGNFLFVINLPSASKNIHVQEGCAMPKDLKKLDDYLVNEIITKIGQDKN